MKKINPDSEQYKKLTLREEILYNPHMYIGPAVRQLKPTWVFDEEQSKIVLKDIEIAIGFCGIFDEILVNAADNFHHSKDVLMTEIRVDIDPAENKISVENNGRGIPIRKHTEYDMYVPQFIFSELLTSSNYTQKKRITGGMNGYGAKLTNIFSTRFIVETYDKDSGTLYTEEFAENMSVINEPIIKAKEKETQHYTKVTFYPDLSKFGMEELDSLTVAALKKRVLDIAGTMPYINVSLNGSKIAIENFREYVEFYGNDTEQTLLPLKVLHDNNKPDHEALQWTVYVAVTTESSKHVSFVNKISTTEGGTHVDLVLNQIVQEVREKLEKKIQLKPEEIKSKLEIFMNTTIPQPTFTTQSKEELCVPTDKVKQYYEVDAKLIKDLLKNGLKDALLDEAKNKDLEELSKSLNSKGTRSRLTGISKLEDANLAGPQNGYKCTLILTEGDSAKSLAVAGIEVIKGGRDLYGVYPLKGKFLNVRDASTKEITENKEISELVKIIGLDINKEYSTAKGCLRYGSIMIMADEDEDGSHIKGLIINFIQHFWPSLCFNQELKFIKYFITPLIKIRGKIAGKMLCKAFFSEEEYQQWTEEQSDNMLKSIQAKYYKGLGTSTSEEAGEYFENLDLHLKFFESADNEVDAQFIDLAFNKKRANDRKQWLEETDISESINFEHKSITFDQFINKELIHFSLYDCKRSIPSIMDGMKPGERKILYSCFKRNLKEQIKVAELAGYVAEHSAYHHGEESLCMTIIQMAQDYTGSNNINVLLPIGEFGNRKQGVDAAASPRYIFTKLNNLTRKIFNKHDELVLNFLEEEGQSIEPEYYAPIIPMILVNGASGIGTGWSTDVPPYYIADIIYNILAKLSDEPLAELKPWYKGFKGSIINTADGFILRGKVKREGDEVIIEEIPATETVYKYKKLLNEMIDKQFISYFTEHHKEKENYICFKIFGLDKSISNEEDLLEIFKLQSKISTRNLVLFNSKGKITRYESAADIFEEYYQVRLELYELRKEAMLNELEKVHIKVSNKYAFIYGIINHTISILGLKHEKIVDQLIEEKFQELDGSYEYLTSMPIHSLTEEHALKLKKEKEEIEQEIEALKNTPKEELWKRDLQELIDELNA